MPLDACQINWKKNNKICWRRWSLLGYNLCPVKVIILCHLKIIPSDNQTFFDVFKGNNIFWKYLLRMLCVSIINIKKISLFWPSIINLHCGTYVLNFSFKNISCVDHQVILKLDNIGLPSSWEMKRYILQTSIINVYQKMIYPKRLIQHHCSTIFNCSIGGYASLSCKLGVRQPKKLYTIL